MRFLICYALLVSGFSTAFINTLPKINTKTKLNYKPSKMIEEVSKMAGNKIGSEWTYYDFVSNIDKHNIEAATIIDKSNAIAVIDGNHGETIMGDNIHFIKTIPETTDLIIDKLTHSNVNFDVFVPPINPLSNIPFGFQLIFGYIVFSFIVNFLRARAMGLDMSSLGSNPMDRLSPKPKLSEVEKVNITFADVAGCDEAKNELVEVVDFLKNPDKYVNAGAKIPKGILLEGEPGTGKTLLARAVAGEAGVNFISASGSEFIEMFVGVGAARVRKLFDTAKEKSPCVIFIDEIDAIGRQRGAGFNSGNDEREQTLNQILTNMDGFEKTTGVIVVAATNRADILDSALVRPGRFDRKVNVPLPDTIGREAISLVHFRNKNVAKNVSLKEVATLTSGFSGADIANLANEAAIYSVRNNLTEITYDNIVDAYEKITIGLPSAVENRDEETIELVAYHEAGHTLLVMLFNDMFDIKRVTVNGNKGGAGGYTLFTPKEKYQSFPTKKFLLANLIIALGGRAAEVILYENYQSTIPSSYADDYVFSDIDNLDITTGASGDLKQANSIARQYVAQFGFDEMVGLYDSSAGSKPFLGRDMAMGGDKMSDETKKIIDKKVAELVEFAYSKAYQIISKNKHTLNAIASNLIENVTISGADLVDYKVSMFI
jgi:cell division protease FtsH